MTALNAGVFALERTPLRAGRTVVFDETHVQRLGRCNRRSARWCRLMQGGRPATLHQPLRRLQ